MFFWIKWWLKNCEKPKKLKVLFGFSLRSQKETKATNTQKQKKPLSFLVFHNSLTIILSKKTKKPWVFLVFSRSRPKKKKKTRQNQKKPNMSLRPNILWKVLFFCFFGFLEVFLILSMELSQRVSKYCFLLVFSKVFCFFGISPWILSQRVVKYCFFLFPSCFDSVHSYYPQDILKNNWLLYI